MECDYKREAECQMRYKELVEQDPVLRLHTTVPAVIHELSTRRVLTSELVRGVSVEKASAYSQSTRNAIGRTILYQTIRELFHWRFMQTDPNFGNFLYDHR
jgi:aarF domain-containing kinase